MKIDEAFDIIWQVISLEGVPEYDKQRLVKVIEFIDSQESGLNAKHEALIALVRRITTLRGQIDTNEVSARGFEN